MHILEWFLLFAHAKKISGRNSGFFLEQDEADVFPFKWAFYFILFFSFLVRKNKFLEMNLQGWDSFQKFIFVRSNKKWKKIILRGFKARNQEDYETEGGKKAIYYPHKRVAKLQEVRNLPQKKPTMRLLTWLADP